MELLSAIAFEDDILTQERPAEQMDDTTTISTLCPSTKKRQLFPFKINLIIPDCLILLAVKNPVCLILIGLFIVLIDP